MTASEENFCCDLIATCAVFICSLIQSILITDIEDEFGYKIPIISSITNKMNNDVRGIIICVFIFIGILIRLSKYYHALKTVGLYDDKTESRALLVTIADDVFDLIQALSLLMGIAYNDINTKILIVVCTWLGVLEEFLEIVFKIIVQFYSCCCIPTDFDVETETGNKFNAKGEDSSKMIKDFKKTNCAVRYGVIEVIIVLIEQFMGLYVILSSFSNNFQTFKLLNDTFPIIALSLHGLAIILHLILLCSFEYYNKKEKPKQEAQVDLAIYQDGKAINDFDKVIHGINREIHQQQQF